LSLGSVPIPKNRTTPARLSLSCLGLRLCECDGSFCFRLGVVTVSRAARYQPGSHYQHREDRTHG
jgi:hypothetical protein